MLNIIKKLKVLVKLNPYLLSLKNILCFYYNMIKIIFVIYFIELEIITNKKSLVYFINKKYKVK